MRKSSRNRGSQANRAAQRPMWLRWPWLLAAVGVLVIVLVTGYGLIHSAQSPVPSAGAPPATTATASDPTLGPVSAPVTLIEYGDFGCSTCRAWEKAGILKAALQKYGDQLHFVWRDFPVITAESPKAAEAGRCAYDQGKFWEYHDLLYQKAPALSVADLKAYAGQLGLDTVVFNQCLDFGPAQAHCGCRDPGRLSAWLPRHAVVLAQRPAAGWPAQPGLPGAVGQSKAGRRLSRQSANAAIQPPIVWAKAHPPTAGP